MRKKDKLFLSMINIDPQDGLSKIEQVEAENASLRRQIRGLRREDQEALVSSHNSWWEGLALGLSAGVMISALVFLAGGVWFPYE